MKKIFAVPVLALVLACASVLAGASWGLHFPKDGAAPTAPATAEALKKFDAYYVGSSGEKVIYLTFDAGFEAGFTPDILDTLKKHEVPAAFFLVGHYFKAHPDLIKRMVDEGHIVANHTMSHPDMSKINDKASFQKELAQVEALYKQITGSDIPRFYRPPSGTYSETNLKLAQELGYKTIFWSAAYKDWDEKKQPSKAEAFSKLLPRTHPGAVVLLHNTSKTNAAILDELISKYKEMGYAFADLHHLTR